jgi:hypothetical protein
MPNAEGEFSVNGIARNGATVKLWSAGSFATPPVLNTALPAGDPLASGTTGEDQGADGKYRFTDLATGEYYVSVEWNGLIAYDYHNVDDGTGLGWTLAQNYANLQAAINATPDGGTLFIPAGTYTISGSTYAWTHPLDGAKTGLVVQNKRINIVGAGPKTLIQPGAANVDVLTLITSSGSAGQTRNTKIESIRLENNGFSGCRGICADNWLRSTFRDVTIGFSAGAVNWTSGLRLRSSFIVDIEDCYFRYCNTGIDASSAYSSSGASHGVHVRGGEIQNCTSGVVFNDADYPTIHGTVIEGCNTVGAQFNGCDRISVTAVYFEAPTTGTPYDVILASGASVWNGAIIEGANLIQARNGNYLIVRGMSDHATSGRLNVDDTVKQVIVENEWWALNPDDNTDSRQDIYAHFQKGYLRVLNAGQPNANAWVTPGDDVGVNLLENPDAADSLNGWSTSHMVSDTSDVPYGARAAFATNITTSGTACSADKAISPAYTSYLQGKFAALSCYVKYPDSTWSGHLRVLDGDTQTFIRIPAIYRDGNWHRISTIIHISSGSTGLQFEWRATVGSSASGVARMAGPTLSLGTIALRPEIPQDKLPRFFSSKRRPYIKAVQNLAASGQVDPTAGPVQIIQGSGGPVSGSTAAAFFSASGSWQDGAEVELVGNSDTNTFQLSDGGSSGIKLKSSPVTMGKGRSVTFRYSSSLALWYEV